MEWTKQAKDKHVNRQTILRETKKQTNKQLAQTNIERERNRKKQTNKPFV